MKAYELISLKRKYPKMSSLESAQSDLSYLILNGLPSQEVNRSITLVCILSDLHVYLHTGGRYGKLDRFTPMVMEYLKVIVKLIPIVGFPKGCIFSFKLAIANRDVDGLACSIRKAAHLIQDSY